MLASLVAAACGSSSSVFDDGAGGSAAGNGEGASQSTGGSSAGGASTGGSSAGGSSAGGASTGGSSAGGASTGGGTTGGASTGGASTGGGSTGGASTGGGSTGGASTGGQGGSGGNTIVIKMCQNQTYECGDTIDNDGDGLIDELDPDCLGPCDNTENSYYGGIPGQAGPACTVDCYFDSNSGSGNDECYWNHQCDPNEVPPSYYPEKANGDACAYDPGASTPGAQGQSCDDLYNAQSAQCASFCGPLTPNGCDCFGCCELPSGSGSYVWLGSEDASGNGTCSIATLADPDLCQPCLPVAGCLNECETCELCLGKPSLPPECFGMGGMGGMGVGGGGAGGAGGAGGGGMGGQGGTRQCPPGIDPCGPGLPCSTTEYCITGCCQPL